MISTLDERDPFPTLLQQQRVEEYLSLLIFPIGLLKNSKALFAVENTVRVKHTFSIQQSYKQQLLDHFIQRGEIVFKEIFHTTRDYATCYSNDWLKIKIPHQTLPSISVKNVTIQRLENNSSVLIKKRKLHLSLPIEFCLGASLLSLLYPVTIELVVTRATYEHKQNENVKITVDHVTFPNGSEYEVCTIFAIVPESQVDALVATRNEVCFKVIAENAVTARSKVIEYLYRQKRGVFNSMVIAKLIPTEKEENFNWDDVECIKSNETNMETFFDKDALEEWSAYGGGTRVYNPKHHRIIDEAYHSSDESRD
jgi:hypothetical protein